MKVFGYMGQESMSNYPPEATDWDSIKQATESFKAFVEDVSRYSVQPCYLFLFAGESTGDEEQYGYPVPDRVFSGYEHNGYAVVKGEPV